MVCILYPIGSNLLELLKDANPPKGGFKITMSEIIRNRASESLGKEVKIFLMNGWRYAGKLLNCDDDFLEILDTRTSSYKMIRITEIKDMEIVQ
jgi:small nuclear ribonucleoprotein (snRNP)-like protein